MNGICCRVRGAPPRLRRAKATSGKGEINWCKKLPINPCSTSGASSLRRALWLLSQKQCRTRWNSSRVTRRAIGANSPWNTRPKIISACSRASVFSAVTEPRRRKWLGIYPAREHAVQSRDGKPAQKKRQQVPKFEAGMLFQNPPLRREQRIGMRIEFILSSQYRAGGPSFTLR